MENRLIGRWRFIGAEKYIGSKWVATDNYVDDMEWEFHPQYFGTSKVIGCITESTIAASRELPYAYNIAENKLKIEIYTDEISGSDDESEADIYELIETHDPNQLAFSILTMEGCPPPYFRYILQAADR
ncbi:MAG: hypothetical protein SNI87_06185 [Rikenellaceae bacterium]